MRRSHSRSLSCVLTLVIGTAMLPTLTRAAVDPVTEVLAQIEAPSSLTDVVAAEKIGALLRGDELPATELLDLGKFLRDEVGSGEEAPAAFLDELVEQILSTLGLGDVGGTDASDLWNVYGLALTVGEFGLGAALPDLQPWLLPHDARSVATYTRAATSTQVSGTPFVPFLTQNVTVGQSFTTTITTIVDSLIGTALDVGLSTDLIVIQVPLSIGIDVTLTCTSVSSAFLGRRCLTFSTTTTTTSGDTVLATDPRYTFAYPLNAGVLATRATGMDVLQSAYDAFGTLHSQKPRAMLLGDVAGDTPVSDLGLELPGVTDLMTQAPPANALGLQASRGGATEAVAGGLGDLTSALALGGLPLRLHDGGSDDPLGVLDPRLGPTVVYEADEVRAGNINVLIIRWHNLGLETVAGGLGAIALPEAPGVDVEAELETSPDPLALVSSAPATIYYDVPEGRYAFGDQRVDDRGGVFVQDWDATGSLPPLSIPPTLPDVETLLGIVETLPGLLEGGLPVPGAPETPSPPGVDGLPGVEGLPDVGGLPGLGDLPDLPLLGG